MRLDKYLKTSKILKRRTVAKEASLMSLVTVNDKIAKPSTLLRLNDVIVLKLSFKTITIKVISLQIIKDTLMYELLKEEKTISKSL
jgi:ribosomal 50S subunit-recycling heat shock protein